MAGDLIASEPMRLLSLMVLVATSAPLALSAQRISRADPAGVMDLRADLVAFGPAFVSPSEDGLVSLTFDERASRAGFHPRDPRVAREVFTPDDVIDWVNSIEGALASVSREQSSVMSTHAFTLGREHGVRITLDLTVSAGERRVRFAMNRCGTVGPPVAVRLDTVMANLAAFRRAAVEAKSLALQTISSDLVWFEHAVACPAVAALQNKPPVWPSAVTTLRPHQELVQFVVNIDGRVEPTSVIFFAKSDERFTRAIREALSNWIFIPATRMGRPVRQLAHVNVGFIPPLATDANRRPCSTGRLSELEVRVISPRDRSPGEKYLRDLINAFGYDNSAYPLHGAIIRFVQRRNAPVSDLQVTVASPDPDVAALARRIAQFSLVGRLPQLPADFAADTIHIEVRFPLRCEDLFTTRFQTGIVSVLPRGDGTVRLANELEGDGRYLITEPSHRFAVVSGTNLSQFVDSASRFLATLDTNLSRPMQPDSTRPLPMIGTAGSPGLTMSMLTDGTIAAAIGCGGYRTKQGPLLRIDRVSFGRFREGVEVAIERLPWQREWSPRGDAPFVEHELTCDVERNSTEPAWVRPQAMRQVSREVTMRYVVGADGRVEKGSIEFMAGLDSATERLVTDNLMTWSFTPPLFGSTPVRAEVHGRYILRPADSDAVKLLGGDARNRTTAEGLTPTVFSKPRARLPAPDRSETWALPGERPRVLQEIRKRTGIAMQTWGAARAQFQSGLTLGDRFIVTLWLHDAMGREEHAYVAVDSIDEQKIHGVLVSPMLRLLDWQPGDRFSTTLPNFADWTIVRADGSVEGNVVAKYIDDYVRHRRRR